MRRWSRASSEAGEEALVDTEVTGLHPEVTKTLGRLRYRFSYGQNQLRHSIETSWLAAALAQEIGADIEVARVGGLLHDVGKAVDRELEGTHAAVGADIARRFNVPREVVHCIEAHHEEVRPETTEALVVIIADAMSGSRPGARRESSEQYVKRLEALESIANSFDGVNQSFAIQAGREVRIIVEPKAIDDRGRDAARARRLEEDRRDAPVSRRDPSHGRARDAGDVGGALTMRVLMVGDVVGRPGRAAVAQILPELRAELHVDCVVLNGEECGGGPRPHREDSTRTVRCRSRCDFLWQSHLQRPRVRPRAGWQPADLAPRRTTHPRRPDAG